MNSCFDVAKYILEKKGPMTTMKLHKILYYCQAWSLVWDEDKLFKEKIEAWINGPVIPELYKCKLDSKNNIFKESHGIEDENQRDTINRVIDYYGDKDSQYLSDLTHSEEPWKKARKGLSPTERGNNEIMAFDMLEYYSSITENNEM